MTPGQSDRCPLCNRDAESVTGPLTLASVACPVLRELDAGSWYQPPAPLAHLTRLDLFSVHPPPEGAAPLQRLADAAPRLEVLKWYNCRDPALAAAAQGHLCLRELRVSGQEEAWLRAVPRLPALSTLDLQMHPRLFEGEEVEGEPSATTWLLCVCSWLVQCKRLSHLRLNVLGGITCLPMSCCPPSALRSAAGCCPWAWLSLGLHGVWLAPTRDAVARAMRTLVACYPHLEVLKLSLPYHGLEASGKEALARELRRAAPALAALCPAVREVWLGNRRVPLQLEGRG